MLQKKQFTDATECNTRIQLHMNSVDIPFKQKKKLILLQMLLNTSLLALKGIHIY